MRQKIKMGAAIFVLMILLTYLSWQSSLVAGGIESPTSPKEAEIYETETPTPQPLTLIEWRGLHRPFSMAMPIEEPIANETIVIVEEIAEPVIEVATYSVDTDEYSAAAYIWQYFKDLGWNDYVCAGIMGNLMSEVGGQTLNIQYNLYSSEGGYYGMCQWSKKYHSPIYGINDLTAQCDYLRDTIQYEIDTFGHKYYNGFNLTEFLNLTDASQAALAFAKCYERCASGSYEIRQRNAITAYNYFVR